MAYFFESMIKTASYLKRKKGKILTHIIQKDLTKNASGQITDHYDFYHRILQSYHGHNKKYQLHISSFLFTFYIFVALLCSNAT